MHSFGHRTNAVATFAVTILATMCFAASFSNNFNTVYIRLLEDAGAGCTSSGSDHDASACLSDFVQAFLETEAEDNAVRGPAVTKGVEYDSNEADTPGRDVAAAASVQELLDPLAGVCRSWCEAAVPPPAQHRVHPIRHCRKLAKATDSFAERNLISRSGFGAVYRGVLADGSVVAVKKMLDPDAEGKDEELTN